MVERRWWFVIVRVCVSLRESRMRTTVNLSLSLSISLSVRGYIGGIMWGGSEEGALGLTRVNARWRGLNYVERDCCDSLSA